MTWAALMAAVEDIEAANADAGALGWAANPHTVRVLRTTAKTAADTASNMIMTDARQPCWLPAGVVHAGPGHRWRGR